jgi:hypothetical protein
MRRWLLAFTLLGSGCFANEGYCYPRQHLSGPEVGFLAGLFALQVIASVADQPPAEPPSPRPTAHPFVGNLRFATGEPAAHLQVRLRGPGDVVSLFAITDLHGDFRFPLPLPPDWYLLGVEDPALEGTVRVWLNEHGPGGLVLTVRPRPGPPPGD